MSEWYADLCNHPDNDYELLLELLCDGQDAALISQPSHRLKFTWYAYDRDLVVPIDWLCKVMETAHRDLPAAVNTYKEYHRVKMAGDAAYGWSVRTDQNDIIITCNGEAMGVVNRKENGLALIMYAHVEDFDIPFFWLFEVLQNILKG